MKKIILSLSIMGVALTGCSQENTKELKQNDLPVYEDEYVFEEYTIMIVDDTGKIYGDAVENDNGIFLEKDFWKDYPAMYDVKPGDKIEVVYDAEDFSKGIYDNMLGVEVK
jgi:hypothetical protein